MAYGDYGDPATPWWGQIIYLVSTLTWLSVAFLVMHYGVEFGVTAHWSWGVVALVVSGIAAGSCIHAFTHRDALRYPIYQALGIFGLMILVGIIFAAALSLTLETAGWAQYAKADGAHGLFDLETYYFWIFLDMIPGLAITDTLWSSTPPLTAKGFVAGIPVVLFRAYVLFGLLSTLRTWFKNRKGSHETTEPARNTL